MATAKSTALTNTQASPSITRDARLDKGRARVALDTIAAGTGDIDATDVLLFNPKIPSNAIITGISLYNDDLDSNCSPALAVDIGLFAAEDFTSTTSSVDTQHSEDDVLDADAYVDGSTTLQAATTSYTAQALDSGTFGPDDALKPCWSVLGYDSDPRTDFRVGITVATGAGTAAAGDVSIKIDYLVD